MGEGRATPDVVVVGGGVIGLACAWALLRRGLRTTVVDPDAPNRRATWAAGGMLAPLGEAREPGPFLEMALVSLDAYPEFVGDVEARSGRDVGLSLNGKLLTASDPDGARRLQERWDWLAAGGHSAEWLDGSEARALEPAISREVEAGILLNGNGRVDPRALYDALHATVSAEGATFVQGSVAELLIDGGRVRGVSLEEGHSISAGAAVLAAGAWVGELKGLPRPLPIRPVKGQMLAMDAPTRPLERVVTAPDAYLIPRETPAGPVVVVGATSEETGFDLSVDEPGQEALQRGASRLVPGLATAPVVERWAGLRPGTPDELPIVGPDPEVDGLVYAAGHFRNGILLAPATALWVSQWVDDTSPTAVGSGATTSAFAPDRW